MIQALLLHILAAIAGLWLAIQLVPGIEFTGSSPTLLLIGTVLGILNAVVKPVLNFITFPIRILTLGLSSLAINLALVWLLQIAFEELSIEGILPLFWTTLIIWGATIPLSLLSKGRV